MHFTTLFLWFFFYSILGWIYETIYCSIRKLCWDNRGMLNGPYCPIYGVGAVLDVLVCSNFPNAGIVFFTCMLGSAIMEYATSYTTEKIFHAVWWDYSYMPLNLNGRICLPYSIGFGVAGILVLYGIQPFMVRLTDPIPFNGQEFLSLLFMGIFSADCALTADSLAEVNVKLENAMNTIDTQISERYAAFIEATKQKYESGIDTIRESISLDEFRERLTMEALKNAVSSMSWAQVRAVRSSHSLRHPRYHIANNKIRLALTNRRRKRGKADETTEPKNRMS